MTGSCHHRGACSLGALASAWLPGRGCRARPPETARTSPRGPTFPLREEREGSRQTCPAGATPPSVALTLPSDPLPLTEPPAWEPSPKKLTEPPSSCAWLRGNVPGRPQLPLTPGPSRPGAGEGTRGLAGMRGRPEHVWMPRLWGEIRGFNPSENCSLLGLFWLGFLPDRQVGLAPMRGSDEP